MPVLSRLSTALRAYIREEYRRVWTRREYLTLLLALAVVEVLRVLVTWIALRGQVSPGNSSVDLLSLVSAMSWMTYVGHFSGTRAFMSVPPQWGFWGASEILSLFPVVLPYYAGRSIAAARKYRELEELRARGLEDREILLGRGIAHLTPFLVMLAAGVAATMFQAGYFMTRGAGPSPFYSGPGVLIQLLIMTMIIPVGSLARMGILVCASALNRRVWGGVAACYALFLLLYPGATLASRTMLTATSGPLFALTSILRASSITPIVVTLVSFAMLALFYRLALRALGGQPLVRLPKLDEPRSLWMDEGDHAAAPGE